MTLKFEPAEWATVLPRRRTSILASPYLQPASIVARERRDNALEECIGCGQLREDVIEVVIDAEHHGTADVCADCRKGHGL